MSRTTLPTAGAMPVQDKARALVALTTCAILLAGCADSLQDELGSSISQSPGGPSASASSDGEQRKEAVAKNSSKTASEKETAAANGDSNSPARSREVTKVSSSEGTSSIAKTSVHTPEGEASRVKPEPAVVRLPESAKEFTSMSEPGNVAYRIGPLDVLSITVFRVPELSTTVQVADTGTINLPLIGEVPAAGRTAQEVEQDVTARLSEKYLQNPQVTVFIKEYNARRVTVDGSVKKPGVYPLRGRTSLLQAITMAEGLDHNRASGDVVVFRQIDGKRKAARFNLDDIRSGAAEDPIIEPGDVIVVDDSTAKVVLHNVLRALPITNVFMGAL